jgi:predicted RNase H-like HicB family nuclease
MIKSVHPKGRQLSEYGRAFGPRSCDPTPKRNVVSTRSIYDAQISFNIEELNERIAQIEQDMQDLNQATTSRTFTTYIISLGVPDLKVKKPIPVTIEREDDENYIASFMDANISTGGNSEQEAVYNLQSLIADLFEMHEEETSELGPAMKIQKQVLHDVLCRISQETTQKEYSTS